VIDMAAERGGNCDITEVGKTVVKHGVTIMGPLNLASSVPYHASMMFARNITAFLTHLIKDQKVNLNLEDDIVRDTLLTNGGEIGQPRVREFLKLPALAK
jgi:NAD(P) transhydrogenase subunit alpha